MYSNPEGSSAAADEDEADVLLVPGSATTPSDSSEVADEADTSADATGDEDEDVSANSLDDDALEVFASSNEEDEADELLADEPEEVFATGTVSEPDNDAVPLPTEHPIRLPKAANSAIIRIAVGTPFFNLSAFII